MQYIVNTADPIRYPAVVRAEIEHIYTCTDFVVKIWVFINFGLLWMNLSLIGMHLIRNCAAKNLHICR